MDQNIELEKTFALVKSEYNQATTDDEIIKFFKKYKRLKLVEFAIILDITRRELYKCRSRLGLSIKGSSKFNSVYIKRVPTLEVLDKFNDTAEWWDRYKEKSLRQLSLSTGLSDQMIKNRLWKHCKKLITKKKHRYDNKEWIYKHYVTMGLSIIKCAKLAGVHQKMIEGWLIKYRIVR